MVREAPPGLPSPLFFYQREAEAQGGKVTCSEVTNSASLPLWSGYSAFPHTSHSFPPLLGAAGRGK